MKIENGLYEIKRILETINTKDSEEKLKLYSVIVAILSGLDKLAEDGAIKANYNQYRSELLMSVEFICGLNDPDGHTAAEHLSWAYSAINKLGSAQCFKK